MTQDFGPIRSGPSDPEEARSSRTTKEQPSLDPRDAVHSPGGHTRGPGTVSCSREAGGRAGRPARSPETYGGRVWRVRERADGELAGGRVT